MYSKETISKVTAKMIDQIRDFRFVSVAMLSVSISAGNRKLGRVKNVSLPPIISCGKACKGTCDGFCYDLKAMCAYPSALKARCKNFSILIRNREQYFAQIEKALSPRCKHKFFRWHVAGDIVDIDYFAHMVDIAKRHPDWIFWTYTKQYHIVNAYCDQNGVDAIPSNLHIMFSEWRGLPMVNPYNFPEFRVVFKDDEIKPTGFYCPGNCDTCKKAGGCIHANHGDVVYCHEH